MKIAILLIALFAAGCSALPMFEAGAQFVVSHYCTDTPELGRQLLRSRVATVVAPNSIEIKCAG